ncbi:MAG: type II secretion system protein N [Pseudomonadota bacterium]
MLRSWIGWALLGLLAYLIALVLTLPARQVVHWAKLPLTSVQGSLWHGSAQVRIGKESIEHVAWRVHPAWPWQGALGAHIDARQQGWQGVGEITMGWNGALHARDVSLDGPLDSPFISRRLAIPARGQARLKLDRATWRHGLAQAEGAVLELRDPAIQFGDWLTLGNQRASLAVRNGRLDAQLGDLGGPLELRGTLQGDAKAGLSFEARLAARPGASPALEDALRLLPNHPQGGARAQSRLSAPWLATPTN